MGRNSSPTGDALSDCVYNAPVALDETLSHTGGLDLSEGYSRSRRYVQDARGCTVGPMPVRAFLDAFLPPIPAGREKEVLSGMGAFKRVPPSGAKPADIFTPLVREFYG